MEEDTASAQDFDCPSLLCEELEDLQANNASTRTHRCEREDDIEQVALDKEEEERGWGDAISQKESLEAEEGEKARPASEAEELQKECTLGTRQTVSSEQHAGGSQSKEGKDEQKKGRKRRRSKKQSERARSRRGGKLLADTTERETTRVRKVPAAGSEEGSVQTDAPGGLLNSCDLSDPMYLSCGGAGPYGPTVPLPLIYPTQAPFPIQPGPPKPHGVKRPHSPLLPHTLSQSAQQPLEMEITQVYSTRRSIRYSTKGRGRALAYPLLQGLETVDGCLLPVPPKKKTRTLYSTDQLEHLEALFHEDHYPDAEKRKVIAASVGVTPQRIMVWFQNRRAKWRKVERSSTKAENRMSRAGGSNSPLHHHHANPTSVSSSIGAPTLPTHFAPKLPQLAPTGPAFPPLSTQTFTSCSALVPSLSSPGQSAGRDSGQHQPPSQGSLMDYHPRPMQSPPPLRRASLPVLTAAYNPPNPTPPLLYTPTHTPPPFLDVMEGGSSSLTHRDTQPLQNDGSSLFDFERLDYLTTSHQNNTLSHHLQSSYPSSNQHQAGLPPHMTYLTPSPYLTPSAQDSSSTSYLTFGPGGGSSGVVTYSTGGHAYLQTQSTGQFMLQSSGNHAYQSYPWSNVYPQSSSHQRAQCPPSFSASMGAVRDHQAPSSATTLAPPHFFSRGEEGPSLPSSHTQMQAAAPTSCSTAGILPPVSSLRPSRFRADNTPPKVAPLLPSQVSHASPESPLPPPCAKIEYDSPRELQSHFHCDFSPIHF